CGSCQGGCGVSSSSVVSLKDMEVGESGTIVRLTSDDDSIIANHSSSPSTSTINEERQGW
ncbi:MAG: hypothetical protein IKN44_04100, partial [Bacteroidaceae bacterium]|nr:hypothetical protein [Bacteroidaceae bacterium]